MVNVKKSKVISGDPEKTWELINQVERYPEWMPGVVEARVLTKPEAESGLGRTQILKTETAVGRAETIQKVIAWKPPHKITWEHVQDTVNGKEFTHAKEIRTTLSITNLKGKVTFRMIGSWQPVGISGKLMNRMMQRTVARNFEGALNNLEKLIQKEFAVKSNEES